MSALRISIGRFAFAARLRPELAPEACKRLIAMVPFRGSVVHARWSGEAIWCPLGTAWPSGLMLEAEQAVHEPRPGEILLFAGERSEPELLIPYGETRFACKAGALAGSPVLLIEEDLARLAECGREVLIRGEMELRIDH